MSVAKSQHTLVTEQGNPLRVDAFIPEERRPGAIVVCHGFKGFREWGFFPFVGETLALDGFATFTFDFSLNGIGETPGEFTELDAFEANTYSQEVSDLNLVMDWVRNAAPPQIRAESGPIGLVAHSRGAVPALVVAAERADEVAAVATWAGVGHPLRYSDRQLAQWEADGKLEFTNARTGQRMALGWGFVVDANRNRDRFDLAHRVNEMNAAHLIIHGSGDLAVDPSEAETLRAGRDAAQHCRLVLIEGATHTFGAVHPFEGPTKHLEEVLGYTRTWFRDYLSAG